MQPQTLKPEQVDLTGADEGCPVLFHSDTLHDVASPVNQLSTMLALLQKRCTGNGGDDDVMFDLIQSSAARLRTLMGGLQAFVRVLDTPVPHRVCETRDLMTAAVSAASPLIQETGARIHYGDLPRVNCDPNQMLYALSCLIDNAIKFRGESPPEIHLSATEEEDAWLFSCRDNGIGIEPKFGQRIFHLFKRLNGDKYPGAGAGLAICRAIVNRHGGRIWLDAKSAPESAQGATFLFTLPKEAI
jgi:light-regulated signal transduction histidine kinase (bacteriophytochrome)